MSDIAGGILYFVFHILILSQASCHKERHVSQKAVSFIHDVLTEVLTSWAELPHFHFNEALFRPFEHIMQLELCDEDVQDQVNLDSPEIKVSRFICIIQQITHTSIWLQVVTSIGELVEMCSPQILSGWRPLFSALRTVHSSKTDTKDYLLGEYSMGTWSKPVHTFLNKTTFVSTLFFLCASILLSSDPSSTFSPPGKSQAPVFDVFEAFINTDNIQVFANAATDYIMCLMKFVKGLGSSHFSVSV